MADAKLPAYTTLDEVIKSYKGLKEETGMSGYSKYMNILIDEVANYNITTSSEIVAVKLPVSSLNVVTWPEDMTDYVVVGLISNERIISFTVNPNIAQITDVVCGAETRGVTASSSNIGDYISYLGGQNDNYFKVNKKRRIIIIEGELPAGETEIYLEYKSTGVTLGGATIVPREMKPMLIAVLGWKDILYDNSYSDSTKREKENLYGKEQEKLRNVKFAFSFSEYLDSMNSTSRQGAKL